MKKIFIIPYLSFFISCSNSHNNEKKDAITEDTTAIINEDKVTKKEATLSSEEVKSRETISKFLEANILNYNTTYTSIEWTKQEKYNLIETSKFFLNSMKKAESQGHSKEDQRAIAWGSYKLLQQSGNAALFHIPKGNGYTLTHKFKHEVTSNGIKTTNLRFYLDSTLNSILHVENIVENVVLPEL